jgi:hypothetical protein
MSGSPAKGGRGPCGAGKGRGEERGDEQSRTLLGFWDLRWAKMEAVSALGRLTDDMLGEASGEREMDRRRREGGEARRRLGVL